MGRLSARPGTKRSTRRTRRPTHDQSLTEERSLSTPIIRKINPYDLLTESELDRIEDHSNWILEHVGMDFPVDDEEILDLFHTYGAKVKNNRVQFPNGLVRTLCQKAPAQFQMLGRDPQHSVTIGGHHCVMTPAYGPPFVTDLEKGRRYATLQDFENFIKLAHMSPLLGHSGGTVCEPVDIPVNKRHLDMVYAHLRLSTKPFMGAVTSRVAAEESIEMARIVFGDETLQNHCVMQANINVNSPLLFDEVMLNSLKIYARAGQGIVLSPFILGGAMGPVTQPALIAQAHAEAMVGIAVAQLIRPGTPVVYGNFLTTMNLKTGAPTFGTAEANLSAFAMGQLSRRLNLPLRCGGHLTASKIADAQAMQESSDSMMAGLLAGGHYILHAAGWLEGGLVMGYEKFMLDLDHTQMMAGFLSGLTIDDNGLAQDAYEETGPGQNFLSTAHTFRNFRTANTPADLADTQSFEQWREEGSQSSETRAHLAWKRALDLYKTPPMDNGIDQTLKDFMAEKRSARPDQWY